MNMMLCCAVGGHIKKMQISDDVTREDMTYIHKFRTWKFPRVKAVLARPSVHVKYSYFVQCPYFQRLFPLPNQNLTYNTKMYCLRCQ